MGNNPSSSHQHQINQTIPEVIVCYHQTNFSVTQSPDRGHNRRSSHFRTGSRGGSNTNTDGINSTGEPNSNLHSNNKDRVVYWNHLKSGSPLAINHAIAHMVVVLLCPLYNNFFQIMADQTILANKVATKEEVITEEKPFCSLTATIFFARVINEGRLVTGTLRVNKRIDPMHMFLLMVCSMPTFLFVAQRIVIVLEGDLVAVELLIVDEV